MSELEPGPDAHSRRPAAAAGGDEVRRSAEHPVEPSATRPADASAVTSRRTSPPTATALAAAAPQSLEPFRAPHRHPSLGLAPIDMAAGFPAAAERLRLTRRRLAALALEDAIDLDPTIETRYDGLGLRRLLHDAELLVDHLTRSVASGDPRWARHYAEETAIVYRRRAVPLVDIVTLLEGIRDAAAAALSPQERHALDDAVDGAAQVFEWNARLAGDARRRNALLRLLYRGA